MRKGRKGLIEIDHGNVFPMPLIIGGIVMIIMGIASISDQGLFSILIGLGLTALGGYLSFSRSGIQIDLSSNMFREYYRYYGFLSGEWKRTSTFPYATVLRNTYSSNTYSRSNRVTNQKESFFEVYLLSKTHRTKIFIKRLNSKVEAEKWLESFADTCSFEVVNYNPKGARN